jgi:hypothetical protein
MWRTAAIVLASIGAASAPATVEAATYKVCVRIIVQTTDTGLSVNGVTEDHYLGTDTAAGLEVIGRGFRVMLLQQQADGSVWARVFDGSTSDGCFSFSRAGSNVYSVVVQGYATDGEDNHVRIHTGGTDTGTWFPGETIDYSFVNQALGNENYFSVNGAEDDRWTTIALAAFGLYRWDNGTSDTIISIGFSEDEDGCGDSSSMWGDSTSYIESLRAHLIKIGHCDTTDQTESRKKMLVTHELGHAMARLYYGHDGAESPLYAYYVPFDFDATDPNYDECVNTLGYNLTSLEANSLAFKEGFADFYSARVWNNAAAHGTYQRFGTPVDLEAWDAAGGTNTPGGYTLNVCGSSAIGVSTRSDYLRFFWDWHTTTACASAASQHDMLELYRRVRENHRTAAYPLTNWNYDDALLNAVATNGGELSGCLIGRAFIYLGHNNGG